MADIFMSYASSDRDFARSFAATLEGLGFSVWWDRTIAPGEIFDEVIQHALDDAKCVVVLWSGHSVGSNWVKTEAAEALSRNALVPVLIQQARLPIEFKRVQCANLTNWNSDIDDPEFRQLLASIRKLAALSTSPTPSGTTVPDRPAPVLPSKDVSRKWPWIAMASIGIAVIVVAAGLFRQAQNKPSADSVAQTNAVTAMEAASSAASSTVASSSVPVPTASVATSAEAQSSAPPAQPSAPSSPVLTQAIRAKRLASMVAAPPVAASVPMAAMQAARINLLDSENGGKLVVAPDSIWTRSNTQYDDQQGWMAVGEAVYAFKDNRTASFNTFSVLVTQTSQTNLKDFVLLVGNDSPTGQFEPIGEFTVQNVRLMESPYQEFNFAPVHARYLKIKLISNQGGRPGTAVLHKFKLMGSLE